MTTVTLRRNVRSLRPVLAVWAAAAREGDLRALAREHALPFTAVYVRATLRSAALIAGAHHPLPPEGDEQRVAWAGRVHASIVIGRIDAAIVLRDPGVPEDPFIASLIDACDDAGVPVATNTATASCVLDSFRKPRRAPWRRHPSSFGDGHLPWDRGGAS